MPTAARLDLGQGHFGQKLRASSPHHIPRHDTRLATRPHGASSHHIIRHDTRLATRLHGAVGVQGSEMKQVECICLLGQGSGVSRKDFEILAKVDKEERTGRP